MVWALAVYFALVALRVWLNYGALRNFLRLPLIERPAAASRLPSVEVIVPALNEEERLPALLGSLRRLAYGGDVQTVVVDQGSTDWTGGIGTENGATVLRMEPAPAGWTPWAFACWSAAREVLSEWLLFTDARAMHEPASLDVAMRFAIERKAEAVAVFPQQRCFGFWERALVPFAFQQHFIGRSPDRVNRTGDPLAAYAPGYLLIEREAYFRAGGHKDAASEVDLAAKLKRAGVALVTARGEGLASVRLFRGFGDAFAGLGPLASVGGLLLACLPWLGLVAGLALAGKGLLVAAMAAYVSAAFELLLWQALFQAGAAYAFVQPVAAVVLLAARLRR